MSTSTELLLASSPATYTDDVSGSSRAWPAPQRSVSGDSNARTHSSSTSVVAGAVVKLSWTFNTADHQTAQKHAGR